MACKPNKCLVYLCCLSLFSFFCIALLLSKSDDKRGHKLRAIKFDNNDGHSEVHQEGGFESLTPSKKSFLQQVVYNRVGKCGSRSMLTIISKLAKQNGFTFHSSPISNRTRPGLIELLEELRTINSLPLPSLYSRHIHYISFARFGLGPPVYINMIRDPIERFTSQYYFQRYGDGNKPEERRLAPWKDGEKSMSINDCIMENHPSCSVNKLFYLVPYFCGQDMMCQRPSQESLARAKIHVVENYLVVGYLEDFGGMLEVLEMTLPNFFKGAQKIWTSVSKTSMKNTLTLKKGSLNETAYAMLRKKMRIEYEFYYFVKARFDFLKRKLLNTTIERNQ